MIEDERITFSDREWEIMLADPAFGYVCANGHSQSQWNQSPQWDGTCYTCESEAEYWAGEDEANYYDDDSKAEFWAGEAEDPWDAEYEGVPGVDPGV